MNHPTIEKINEIGYRDGLDCHACKHHDDITKSCKLHGILVADFASCNFLDNEIEEEVVT
jgi:hypothetical protein